MIGRKVRPGYEKYWYMVGFLLLLLLLLCMVRGVEEGITHKAR